MDKAKIGTILKKRIKEQGYTQEEFAEKAGIGLSSLKKYINGSIAYSYEHLIIFSEILDCSYNYLLGKNKSAYDEYKEIREKIHLSDKAIQILIDKTNKSIDDDTQSYYMKTLELLIENENIIDDIAIFFTLNKTTSNFMNEILEDMGVDEKLPFGNEVYLFIMIISELKDIKYDITESVIEEYKNSKPEQLWKKYEEEMQKIKGTNN